MSAMSSRNSAAGFGDDSGRFVSAASAGIFIAVTWYDFVMGAALPYTLREQGRTPIG